MVLRARSANRCWPEQMDLASGHSEVMAAKPIPPQPSARCEAPTSCQRPESGDDRCPLVIRRALKLGPDFFSSGTNHVQKELDPYRYAINRHVNNDTDAGMRN